MDDFYTEIKEILDSTSYRVYKVYPVKNDIHLGKQISKILQHLSKLKE